MSTRMRLRRRNLPQVSEPAGGWRGAHQLLLILCAILLILATAAATRALTSSNIDPVEKWAWSTNAGWINFNPTCAGCEGATVYKDHLEGYAWGENIGWIRLGTHTGGPPHTYANTSATDYGLNRDAAGNLSGYAWGTNVGWIDFAPVCDGCGGGVTIDLDTGSFDGYAWAENVGWIHFKNASPAYNVVGPAFRNRAYLPVILRDKYLAPPARTGQTVSYGAGDDGALQKGVPWPQPRFVDNGDGTITDKLTNLIWLEDADCGAGQTWSGALSFANALHDGWTGDGGGGDCGLADGSEPGDWHLPSVNELYSLVYVAYDNPSVPNTAGTGQWAEGDPFTGLQPSWYWSSTTYETNGRYVDFGFGVASYFPKTGNLYAWPVRGGGAAPAAVPRTGQTVTYAVGDDGDLRPGVGWPAPRFVDNGNGTVTDRLTGLIWLLRADCGSVQNWNDALTLAHTLHDGWTGDGSGGDCGLGDGSQPGDWRLPNAGEMRSLVHYGVFDPTVPNTAGAGQWTVGDPFTGVQSNNYWTSSTSQPHTSNAWRLDLREAFLAPDPKFLSHYVWPVRDGP